MSPMSSGAPGSSRFFAEWNAPEPDGAAARPTPAPRRRLVRRAGVIGTLGALAAGAVLSASTAQADPSSNDWYRLRMCESSNNYSINTGNGYYGAYQFDLSTWRSVGGSGYPNQASAGEQDARALILYRERGWQPWTCAGILGLREDSDARSGRISDIHVPGSGGGTTGGVPAYPSTRSYSYGDSSSVIKSFQDQMHKRGAIPPGTGYYGSLTLAVVKRLQSLNGLTPSGLLGPLTWHAAFAGKWSAPSTGGSTPPPSAPAYPSTRSYSYGDSNSVIAAFQKQMHKRGATQLQGTGQYGPLTLAVVKRLQSLNGLTPSGLLGPLTWHAAFAGKWSNP